MKRLGIVTALAPEAAIVRRAAASPPDNITASIVILSGPGPDRAQHAARELVDEGSTALLSFGVAGGLDPALRPGDIVVADRVIGPDRSIFHADAGWSDRLRRTGRDRIGMKLGNIAGVDQPLRNAREKAALFATTGAVALDMESFGVARIAHEANLDFLAVRAIADPASRTVPAAAIRAMGPDGRTHPLKALLALLANPSEIGDFVKLARDGQAAFAALRRVASLGSGFGLV